MPYFLTIREGDAPEDSYHILATADPDIIQLVIRGLVRKFGDSPRPSRIAPIRAPVVKSLEKDHDE